MGKPLQAISPAAERNKESILEVLNPFLPARARLLEIASGTGQHAHYVCMKRPDIVWQPSDPDPASLASIESFRMEMSGTGFLKPIPWSLLEPLPENLNRPFDVVVNINMIHISPWEACLALLDHCKTWLAQGGVLYLYGPYLIKNRPVAPSNLDFNQSLQERDPRWGLRDLDRVRAEAEARGLRWLKTVDMPANNFSVIFERQAEKKDS